MLIIFVEWWRDRQTDRQRAKSKKGKGSNCFLPKTYLVCYFVLKNHAFKLFFVCLFVCLFVFRILHKKDHIQNEISDAKHLHSKD